MCSRPWTSRHHRSSVAGSAISKRRISNPRDCYGQSCISPTLLPLLFSHGELCHFISTSFESSMLACTSVHRPDNDVLLSFPFLLDRIHKFLCHPIRKSVAICNLSADEKSTKGGHVTSGVVFVVRPVCWSDLTFQQDCLRGSDRRSMEKRPGEVLVIFERRWRLEVTGLWKWKDECKHVGGR